MTGKSIALFVAAALAEIGGAYLVWVAIRDAKGVVVGLLGALSLVIYGVVAAFQPENEFGRVLAAYGGVFIVGSMAWGVAFDQLPPRPLRLQRSCHLPRRRRGDHVRAPVVDRRIDQLIEHMAHAPAGRASGGS